MVATATGLNDVTLTVGTKDRFQFTYLRKRRGCENRRKNTWYQEWGQRERGGIPLFHGSWVTLDRKQSYQKLLYICSVASGTRNTVLWFDHGMLCRPVNTASGRVEVKK